MTLNGLRPKPSEGICITSLEEVRKLVRGKNKRSSVRSKTENLTILSYTTTETQQLQGNKASESVSLIKELKAAPSKALLTTTMTWT